MNFIPVVLMTGALNLFLLGQFIYDEIILKCDVLKSQ
jgi:hypothetical protein